MKKFPAREKASDEQAEGEFGIRSELEFSQLSAKGTILRLSGTIDSLLLLYITAVDMV